MMLPLILAAILASPSPQPTDYVPPCLDAAIDARQNVSIFLARHDRQRALEVLVAAARSQDACSTRFRTNAYGRYNMWENASDNYAQAADLAESLHQYQLAASLALASNRLYRLMLANPPRFGFLNAAVIRAEITANNDLLARLAAAQKQ